MRPAIIYEDKDGSKRVFVEYSPEEFIRLLEEKKDLPPREAIGEIISDLKKKTTSA